MDESTIPLGRLIRGEGPVLGRGAAADGGWELRALFDEQRGLSFYLDLLHPSGRRAVGGGCGGVEPADLDHPVTLTMSRRGLRSTFCWIGQIIPQLTEVNLTLTDGSHVSAAVLEGELPVKLFVAFTDRTAVPTRLHAAGPEGEEHTLEVAEHWPGEGNAVWGLPEDDESFQTKQ